MRHDYDAGHVNGGFVGLVIAAAIAMCGVLALIATVVTA